MMTSTRNSTVEKEIAERDRAPKMVYYQGEKASKDAPLQIDN